MHKSQSTVHNFKWGIMSALLVLAGLLAACGSKPAASTPEAEALLAKIPAPATESQQAPNTFLGTVPGSDYYVGLVIQGETVVGYLCDGKTDAWLTGKVEGDYITLTSQDGATLKATLADKTVRGKVVLADGQALDFTAAPQAGSEGLYRSKLTFGDNLYVGGWIILENGTRGFLHKIFGGGKGGGNAPAPTTAPLDDCQIYQQDFNNSIAASNNTKLSAQERKFETDNAMQILTDAGNFGCIIDPFGGEQP